MNPPTYDELDDIHVLVAAQNAFSNTEAARCPRGIKQCCGIARAQHRSAVARRNHIGVARRGCVRLERHRLRTGTSWLEAKAAIAREAIRAYLAQPRYAIPRSQLRNS